MLALPAFRSFFSLARAVRMSLARLQRVHPLVERPLGGRGGGLDWGGHVGGEYSRGSRARKGMLAISAQIHLDLDSRSRSRVSTARSTGELGGDPAPGPRVAEALGPDRDQRRAGGEHFERVGAARRPLPCRRSADLTAAATARTWATAIGRTAGPERPP